VYRAFRHPACVLAVAGLGLSGAVAAPAGQRYAQIEPQAALDQPAVPAGATPEPSDASFGQPAAPSSQDETPRPFAETLCLELGWASQKNDLPSEFFTRLIWQESRFNSRSVSRAGALGIAQFMPGTARWRGLDDPFEPIAALHESARWLRELRAEFGNLGLAAAAYNAGPRRVHEWLEGRGPLPGETRAYVRIITGRTAEEWVKIGTNEARDGRIGVIPCDQIARIIAGSREASLPPHQPAPGRSASDSTNGERAAWAPWGLQLTGNWSEAQALAAYRDLQKKFPAILGDRPPLVLRGAMAGRGTAAWYRVRVAETTRERANQLCAKLESAGGRCLVYRN
jgi:hypothetical protein